MWEPSTPTEHVFVNAYGNSSNTNKDNRVFQNKQTRNYLCHQYWFFNTSVNILSDRYYTKVSGQKNILIWIILYKKIYDLLINEIYIF